MEVGWKRGWLWWKRRSSTETSSLFVKLWWALVPVQILVVCAIFTLWASKGTSDAVAAAAANYNPTWLWRWPSTSTTTTISNTSMMKKIPSTTLSAAAHDDQGISRTTTSASSSNVVVDDEDPHSFSPPKHLQQPSSTTDHDAVPDDDGSNNPRGIFKLKFNTSVSISPPVAVEVIREIQKPELQKEEISINVTKNSSRVKYPSPLINESQTPSLNPRIRRKFSNLGLLEAKLQQSRSAIKEATKANQLDDPDYVPTGPMYWNAKAFHRSYLEMEKQFKIYVYEEGEPPIFHNGPCGSIYSMEGNFIHQMENSKFRTRDLDKAHVYFLPISMASIVHFIFERNSKGNHWLPMKQTVKDYVNLVAVKYPYWNRSIGSDHFVLSCHDWGPELSKSVPELFKNSIRALCNANTSEGFNPSKDVSIPEINLPKGTLKGLIGGPAPSHRPILAFFAGGLHGPIRPVLLEHWENKDGDIQVQRYLPKGVSYYGMLKKSKFCICPSGYEVASPRIVEALYSGCVPVIIKDHYVSPFGDVLNWSTFSVEIPVNEIPNLKKILSGIPSRQYIRLQRRGKQIRRHFEVNWPPKRYDVFHMILHSVWLRRLNIRLRGLENL